MNLVYLDAIVLIVIEVLFLILTMQELPKYLIVIYFFYTGVYAWKKYVDRKFFLYSRLYVYFKCILCRKEDIPEKDRTVLNKKATYRLACPLDCKPHVLFSSISSHIFDFYIYKDIYIYIYELVDTIHKRHPLIKNIILDVIYPASINVTTAGTETKINSSETAAETIYTNMPENNDVCIERRIPSKKRKGVQNLFMERKGVLFATGVSVILLVFTGIVVYTFVQQSE
uniref:ORFan n=1 Tax=Heterorhabditis bacteriophora TaxID=37862 RepID=A0A1I7X1B4_HETBA